MGSRATFLTGALVLCVVLLLGVAWLAELPPFTPSDEEADPAAEVGASGKVPDDKRASDAAEGASESEPPVAVVQPGLKSTAPVQPPADAPPPPGPDRSDPPVRPGVVMPDALPPADDPGPVALELPVSGKTVTKSIDKAVAWLRKKQARDGSWGYLVDHGAYKAFHNSEPVTQRAGPTALAIYTLLRARTSMKDPVVKQAFRYLREHHAQPATSMESAMVLLAVLETAEGSRRRKTDPPRLRGIYRNWASKLVDHLVGKRSARGWRYNVTGRVEPLQRGGPEDLVSTHLATLALFSAYRVGIKTKDRVWEAVLRYTLEQQEGATLHRPDPKKPRGFAYIQGHPVSDEGKATGGTTACGIALIRMTLFVLSGARVRAVPLQESDLLLHETARESMLAAYAWLDEHWSPYANPGKKKGAKVLHHHWLWALETAQDLERMPPATIGKHAWYADISRELINRQHADGHWRVKGSWGPADTLDTCFAILFLKRATRGLMQPR